MKKRFGAMKPSANRMLAYSVQQLRILSRSTTVVERDVNQALDLAEKTGIPVFLHIDSCYGWGADGEKSSDEAPPVKFWQQAEMREWVRFPQGDALPDRIPRMWINWGPWCSPAPAVPAFGSRKFVEFAVSQFDKGVLEPLTKRLEAWRSSGREHLFAGINVAWEAHVPDYGDAGLRSLIERAGGVVRAEYPRSARGLEMDSEFVGKSLGYASLHWRGWNEERLQAAAEKEGLSRDAKFQHVCYESLHDYMEGLAKACHDRGISAERVYTHIVALASIQEASTTRPPIWVAVNRYATPGFTMDNRGGARYELTELLKQIGQANGGQEARFGVVESYFRLGRRVYFDDAAKCRSELEAMFAAGATVQVFYGSFPLDAGRIPKAALEALDGWVDEGESRTKK